MAHYTDFTTIRTEGALLPPDLLRRIRDNDTQLPGLNADAYHLVGHARISEAISEAWNKLQGAWATFQAARSTIPADAPGTAVTRDRWLLPLFQVLDYGRLQATTARELNGKSYPISHAWSHVPIHLVGCNVDLDQRTAGVAGAARQSPHGLMQAYLNASDESLWGIVSNGLKVRLLRDSRALTRQTYLEFDLEAMLSGEAYSDFVLLYLTLHQSRLEGDRPENTILEQWTQAAQEQGTRALDRLRDGVERALATLGQGFLEHPANQDLLQALKSGALTPQDYYRQLLRVIYRFLVIFAAEDRDLLHPPESTPEDRERYSYYSTRRLRELADAIPGGRHPDQYELLKQVWRWFGGDGVASLAIPALGGFLFSRTATPDLDPAQITNRNLLTAIRHLAYTHVENTRYPIDYKNLGAEELGSVYESLLELVPQLDLELRGFELRFGEDNERRATGSYYTPTSLIRVALNGALNAVIERAVREDDPVDALLKIRVLDPSCGSGHFLIAAGHAIARRLAQVRSGDDEPTPVMVEHALRQVIGRCLFGVDLNDMAAELCRVALWLEALVPGKPLTFLEHHIRTGNSLVSAPLLSDTAEILREGIPDEAYITLPSDEREIARQARSRNRIERAGQSPLFDQPRSGVLNRLAEQVSAIEVVPDEDIAAVRTKEALFQSTSEDSEFAVARRIADAWVAAHFWPLQGHQPQPITSADLHLMATGALLEPEREQLVRDLVARHGIFHWHLAFPSVMSVGGFDVVVGNPPYVDSESMARSEPRQRSFIAGTFESASGNWDMYVPFVERAVDLAKKSGSVALVTPAKILAADYAAALQAKMLRTGLIAVHDFSDARPFRDADIAVAILVTNKQEGSRSISFVKYDSNLKARHTTQVGIDALRNLPPGFISAPLQTTDPSILGFLGCPNRLKDVARVGDGATTGEAYEIRDFVTEIALEGGKNEKLLRLANTGTIDPFRVLWGVREIRYLGFRGFRPVISAADLGAISARRLEQAMFPKVIVAGLSNILEAAFADIGVLCGKSSVQVIPTQGICSYAVTALLNAPCVTLLYSALFGTRGFGAGSMNIGGRQLEQLPLPQLQFLEPLDTSILETALEPKTAQEIGLLLPRGLLSAIGKSLSRDGGVVDGADIGVSSDHIEHLDQVVRQAYEMTLTGSTNIA